MRTGSRRKRLQEVPIAPPCRQDELLSASAVGQRALRHGAEGGGVGGALAASALVQRVEQHAASRRRRDDGGATAGSAGAKPSHSTEDRWPRSSVARLISDNLGHSASSRPSGTVGRTAASRARCAGRAAAHPAGRCPTPRRTARLQPRGGRELAKEWPMPPATADRPPALAQKRPDESHATGPTYRL